MSIQEVNQIKACGRKMARDEMSKMVIAAVNEFDGESYKDAMQLAGKLKAIAIAAQTDDYWTEKVNKGFEQQLITLLRHTGDLNTF